MARRMSSENTPKLIHFTSEAGFIGILTNGFALLPCDRRLLDDLFGTRRPFTGDPRNFGMVCFTDAPPSDAGPVRKKGDYGISMKFEWAVLHGARKVQYVGRLRAWMVRHRFRREMNQLPQQIDFPDDRKSD